MSTLPDARAKSKQRSKENVERTAAKILKAFETGSVPKALAPIFVKRAGRHCDSYSYANQLLVALDGWTDAMGYGSKDKTTGWLSVGRQVSKGAKATHILAPCTKVVPDPKAENGKRVICFGFKVKAVFGLEQAEVADAALWAKHNKGNEQADQFLADLPLREVAEAWGLTLQAYNGRKSSALGWYRHGEAIALGVENLATWAHELVHAADFKNGKLVERGQHWRSETVAELGGAILLYAMGYETDADLGGAYDYVTRYAKSAGIEPIRACTDVLNRTCEAVTAILEQAEAVQGRKAVA